MKDAFVSVFGKPMGIVLFQLLDATQFTIYLSLIAFVGGGIVAVLIAFLRIAPRRYLLSIASTYIWLFQSVPLLMLLFLLGLGVPRLLARLPQLTRDFVKFRSDLARKYLFLLRPHSISLCSADLAY